MASCRSEKKVVIAKIKGEQGGKRRENNASGEDLACKSVWLAMTAATATVRIYCGFLLTSFFCNYQQVGNGMQNQILLPLTLQTLVS